MTLINDFFSLIYPRHCEACTNSLFKHELYICNYCKLNLPKSNYHHKHENELLQTFGGRVPLQYGCSLYLFEKSGKVQKLLHAIKYQQQKELAQFIGELYALDLANELYLKDIDIILPIPLHDKKLKLRGYNQSEWFAKGLAKGLKKPLDIASFRRIKETNTQTKKKKYKRWENVEGIFKLNNAGELINKHVLIVDDVVTTGATIEAAWMALKEVEGIKLSLACMAFASRKL